MYFTSTYACTRTCISTCNLHLHIAYIYMYLTTASTCTYTCTVETLKRPLMRPPCPFEGCPLKGVYHSRTKNFIWPLGGDVHVWLRSWPWSWSYCTGRVTVGPEATARNSEYRSWGCWFMGANGIINRDWTKPAVLASCPLKRGGLKPGFHCTSMGTVHVPQVYNGLFLCFRTSTASLGTKKPARKGWRKWFNLTRRDAYLHDVVVLQPRQYADFFRHHDVSFLIVLLVSVAVVDGKLDDDVTMVPPLTTLEDDAVRAATENPQRLVADATTQLVAPLRARL